MIVFKRNLQDTLRKKIADSSEILVPITKLHGVTFRRNLNTYHNNK
jgi:hypothetical protein